MAEAASQHGLRIAAFSRLDNLWLTFRRALAAAYRDNCLGIAKGAAYSALLSFFPVLTPVTALLVQANAYAVSRMLSQLIFQVVPPGTEELVMQIFTTRGKQPGYLLVLASLLSVWAASGIMLSLMEGFRAAYHIPTGRPLVRGRVIAALLVFSAGLPVLAASALLVFGARIENWIFTSIGVVPRGEELRGWIAWLLQGVRMLVAFAAIVLSTSLLYCIGPNPPRRYRTVWRGAILAAVLWWVATTIFAWYVRNIAGYNVLYGSVGAVIALLVWMYLLSVIALIGCEYNAVRERALQPG
jgi:membrane protein